MNFFQEKKQEDITFFAHTNFRNRMTPFGIKVDDRRRHMYVIGKTGMGKTTLLENMCIQDIQVGRGVCFIDPHGDSLQKILDCIPTSRINDVIYFNPADLEYPIAFNILESVDTKYKHLVASGLMGVFTKIWANMWSARMEYILNNTILALLDSPGNTMLGITRMYIDKKYRTRIVANIKDPIVRAFWTEEYANYNEKYRTEAIAPIQNKVGQFLSSAIVRNIVGQTKSTLDLRSVMDDKKILLMDLSKGKVGEDNSALLGAMVITKLQLAALSRVDVPEEDRQDYYLYVDEFQNFATESFATILSEARKYRLNLMIGHQYIGQLTPDRNNTKIRDAVFGNVGSMVVFRVGASDAEFLETEFAPYFTPNDLVNLPKANIILKLMIDGVTSEAFSAQTIAPVYSKYKSGNADKVIKVSRERYANHYTSVEEKISRWMGIETAFDPLVEELPAPEPVRQFTPSKTPFNISSLKELSVPEPVKQGASLKAADDVDYSTLSFDEDEPAALVLENNENKNIVPVPVKASEEVVIENVTKEKKPEKPKNKTKMVFDPSFTASADRQLSKKAIESQVTRFIPSVINNRDINKDSAKKDSREVNLNLKRKDVDNRGGFAKRGGKGGRVQGKSIWDLAFDKPIKVEKISQQKDRSRQVFGNGEGKVASSDINNKETVVHDKYVNKSDNDTSKKSQQGTFTITPGSSIKIE